MEKNKLSTTKKSALPLKRSYAPKGCEAGTMTGPPIAPHSHLAEIANKRYLEPGRFDYMMAQVDGREYWGNCIFGYLRQGGKSFTLFQAWSADQSREKFKEAQNGELRELVSVKSCKIEIPAPTLWAFIDLGRDIKSPNDAPSIGATYNSYIMGPSSALKCEKYPLATRKRCNPFLKLGLQIGSAPTSIGYRLNDHPEAFAESILNAWEMRISEKIAKSEKGSLFLSRSELNAIRKSETKVEVDLVTKQLAQQAALKKLVAQHIESGLLPETFYEFSSPEYIDFARGARISDSNFTGYYGGVSTETDAAMSLQELYIKDLGIDIDSRIQTVISGDIVNNFRDLFIQYCSVRVLKRMRRVLKCENQELDNRLSITKQFISSITQRSKLVDSRSSAHQPTPASELNKWMIAYGNTIADYILDYQVSIGGVFHIDHKIPLAAMPLEDIEDVWSLGWHPSNLCILPEEENLAKGSMLEGVKVRRSSLTAEDLERSVNLLQKQYSEWLGCESPAGHLPILT